MSYESPHAVTLADTPPVLRLQTEKADRRLMHVTGLNLETAPRASKAAPVDSQHSIQGAPTTRVLDHAHIQDASHDQGHTNPITEKERVQASKRDLARRPTASQRAARARAARSGREDGTASGRGVTRSAPARRCPRAKKRSQDTKGTSTLAHARPRRAAPQKERPSPPPTGCPTPAVTWPAPRA